MTFESKNPNLRDYLLIYEKGPPPALLWYNVRKIFLGFYSLREGKKTQIFYGQADSTGRGGVSYSVK